MKQQRPEIIRDNKKRGEWAESVFAARAAENGLAVSRPAGDSESFDYVIGGPGKFVAVQVKCTIAKMPNAKGYICNLKCNNKKYREGSFDFLAAYAILEDTWYIVPEEAIRGLGSICLCSTMPKYEKYREAWELLRSPLLAKEARNGAPSGDVDSHFSQNLGEVGHPQNPNTALSGDPGVGQPCDNESAETARGPAMARMQAAMNSFRGYLEKGGG